MPLMEFMYIGEKTILQDNINDFLSVARELEVSGLEDTLDQETDVEEDVKKIEEQADTISTPEKPTTYSCNQCKFSGKTKESRDKHIELVHSASVTIDEESKPAVSVNKQNNVLLEKRSPASQSRDIIYQCNNCQFEGRTEKSLQQHTAIVHATSNALKCNLCPFKGSSTEALRKHNMITHLSQQNNRDPKHACDQCNFKTFKTSALNIHKLLKHSNASKIVDIKHVAQKIYL